jgi:hypothetical protein
VLAGVAAIEIVMAVVLIPSTDHARIETTDFLNFHVGATIVREGQGRSLYQAETQQLVLKSILGHRVTEYYLHPPFEALAFLPLSYLRIERAFVIWTLLNTALLGTLPLLFAEYVSFISRKPYLGLLGFAFPPVIASLTLGQDSILVLFCISVAYLLGEKRRDFADRTSPVIGHRQVSNCADFGIAASIRSEIPTGWWIRCRLRVFESGVRPGHPGDDRIFQIRAPV